MAKKKKEKLVLEEATIAVKIQFTGKYCGEYSGVGCQYAEYEVDGDYVCGIFGETLKEENPKCECCGHVDKRKTTMWLRCKQCLEATDANG